MLHIADWLNRLGMSGGAERSAQNDVDFSVLRHLTDQHLKDLGVSLRSPVEDAARDPSNSHCDRAAAAGRCRVTPAHGHVLRPCGVNRALSQARRRGTAWDHQRNPPKLRKTGQSDCELVTNAWKSSPLGQDDAVVVNSEHARRACWCRQGMQIRPG